MLDRRALLAGTMGLVGSSPALAQKQALVLTVAPRVVYFVDGVSGNDSNNGLSPSTAWKTITKVNAGVYSIGTTILFKGGQTFSGGISLGTANYSVTLPPTSGRPLTIGSYGTGNATISSGSSNGFFALNIGCFTVRDLTFVGGSATTTTIHGVYANNNQAGDSKLQSITFSNLDVSLYGGSGINIGGTGGAATAGFNGILITGCTVHNCTGGLAAGDGSSGIYVYSDAGYGKGPTVPSHRNVMITGCIVHDCTGKAGDTLWTGSGIFVGQTSVVTIQHCVAYTNGGNSTSPSGPVGIWFSDVGSGVIQICESYNNLTGNQNDGIGFDLDGGCVNCTIQYCYSHGNRGGGYLIYGYNDSITSYNTNSTIRYCVSQNDGTDVTAPSGCITIGNDSASVTGVSVYGNTCYQSSASQPVINMSGANLASITGHVANNIFYCTSGLKLIDFRNAGNPSGLLFTGNDYFSTGTFSLKWNVTTYTSFAAWQTATGQEKISSVNVGLTSNPLLTSPGGGGSTGPPFIPTNLTAYQLQHGSPMIGAGINLQTQFSISPGALDFYGNAIPNGGAGTGFNVGADGANR